jgi:hypothetical protein
LRAEAQIIASLKNLDYELFLLTKSSPVINGRLRLPAQAMSRSH